MNNIIQLKNFERHINNGDEYWQEQYERKEESRLHIDEKVVESKIYNNSLITGRIGELKVVTFYNLKQVIDYEKQECNNKEGNLHGSWVECKEKFQKFPCIIYCRYMYLGEQEGYLAIYLTLDEYIADMENNLKEAKELKMVI